MLYLIFIAIMNALYFFFVIDLPAIAARLLFHGSASFRVGVHVRQCSNQRIADLHLDGRFSAWTDITGARRQSRYQKERYILWFCGSVPQFPEQSFPNAWDRRYLHGSKGSRWQQNSGPGKVLYWWLSGHFYHTAQPTAPNSTTKTVLMAYIGRGQTLSYKTPNSSFVGYISFINIRN